MNKLAIVSLFGLLSACSSGDDSRNPRGGSTLGLAVISSDFMSTSVSLVDPATGAPAPNGDGCIDSGSKSPVLSMALSGDVALPSQTQPKDELLLIDRTNAALAWLDPTSCAVKRQASVGTGFYANPHDVVAISAEKAYVTRYEKNATPTGNPPNMYDGGDDLLIINPTTGAVTGRIDLAGQAVGGSGIQARPDRAILASGKVYVSLNNQDAMFKKAGPGRVVVIDPAKDAVVDHIDFTDLKNCTGLDYVASAARLVVSCGGDYNAADQAAESGVVVVDIGGEKPTVAKTIHASALGGRPLGGTVGAVSDKLALAGTNGDFSGTPPDALWAIDLAAGTASKVVDGDGAFVLGGVSVDLSAQRLYVTSASMKQPRVLVFDVSNPSALKEVGSFESSPRSGLPPRAIAWY